MSHVVICHGIGYQHKHAETMLTEWYEALRVGVTDAAHPVPDAGAVSAVYYGSCFRSRGVKGGGVDDELEDIPAFQIGDVRDPLELELLKANVPKLRDPASAGLWTTLIIAAHTQLWLARPATHDLHRPCERPLPTDKLTPARVRRGFRNIRAKVARPAAAPKPSRPGPGRPRGSSNRARAPRHTPGKTVKRAEALDQHYGRTG
ncbi:hypothetical protein OG345_03095 [Streptomyces sp. NBC_01220]|nr:hypothetical protein OG345_03095 [Streptomyces sp. NBC_01220]